MEQINDNKAIVLNKSTALNIAIVLNSYLDETTTENFDYKRTIRNYIKELKGEF